MPKALLEAAQIDGAGHLVLFLRVLLPLTVPAIASLSIFQFLWVWNDMMIALIFAEPVNAPLTTAIFSQMRNFASNVDVIAPGAFLQMLVPLIIFFLFQRQLVQESWAVPLRTSVRLPHAALGRSPNFGGNSSPVQDFRI